MLDPVWIVLVGVTIVLVGILALRLHAFLALTLAALAVASLTSPGMLQSHNVQQVAAPVVVEGSSTDQVVIDLDNRPNLAGLTDLLIVRTDDANLWQVQTPVRLLHTQSSTDQTQAVAQPLEAYEPRPGDLAVHPLDWRRVEKSASTIAPVRVATAFGSMCGKVGILIAMAAIVGKCLLESGAADRIVRRSLAFFGERNAPVAFISSGFLLSIPVFFDTVFYLMIPLAKALRIQTGKNYLLYVLSLIVGGTMAHSLVPPTPGPLIVVEQFGIDLGLMIIAGCCVGVFTSIAGYFYSKTLNHYWDLPLRETPDMTLQDIEEMVSRKTESLPPLWLSLLPILLPLLLIGNVTVFKVLEISANSPWMRTAQVLGDKNVALILAAAISLGMLAWQKRATRADLTKSVAAALSTGGIIILITAAGGAFGEMLAETGITKYLAQIDTRSPIVLLLIGYFLTTLIRTIQGSATVAMITSSGVLAGMADPAYLGFHPVYLALAIGCGSKPIMWMNDSGFWTMCKMSGMTDIEGLKAITTMTAFISLVGLGVTIIGAIVLPLV